MKFDKAQTDALSAPLSRDNVKTRSQAGRNLSYIESWVAIKEANRIFGFDGWSRETIEMRMVSEREREIGQQKVPGWSVSYVGRVRVTVGGVVREGVGAGHGIDRDLGLAHESAIKECESDCGKRALMTFGNPFGLALYDKEQAEVEDAPTSRPQAAPQAQTPSKPSSTPTPSNGAVEPPHKPVTTAKEWGKQTLETVRGLDPKDLDGFMDKNGAAMVKLYASEKGLHADILSLVRQRQALVG